MQVKILIYFLISEFTNEMSAWNLSMWSTPILFISRNFQIKCSVTGDSEYAIMRLYCPTKQKNAVVCFENCQKRNINSHAFSNFKCVNFASDRLKTFLYTVDSVDESFLEFNNSNFACQYMNKQTSTQLIVLNKNDNLFLQYLDIIIVIVLLFISLSFNVAFCSWHRQNRKYKKINDKLETNAVESTKETLSTSNHQRKCRSLDLPQRREMQQILTKRNQSVIILPFYPIIQKSNLSPSPSMSYNFPLLNDYGDGKLPKKTSEKIVINYTKNVNTSEQVSSFKSAMENKLAENIID